MSTKNSNSKSAPVKFIYGKDFDRSKVRKDKPKGESQGFRIGIKYEYNDGVVSDLIIVSPPLFSFGICDPPQKKVDGKVVVEEVKPGAVPKHVVSFVCWNRNDKPKQEEQEYINAITEFCDECNEIMKDEGVRKDLKQNIKTPATYLKNLLYYKLDKDNQPDHSLPPTFSPKLIKDKQGTIKTLFSGALGDAIADPMADLYKQFFTGRVATKFEGIWVGTSSAIQAKAYQVVVLEKKTQVITPIIPMEIPLLKSVEENDDLQDDVTSLNGDMEARAAEQPKKPAPAPVAPAKPAKPTKKVVSTMKG